MPFPYTLRAHSDRAAAVALYRERWGHIRTMMAGVCCLVLFFGAPASSWALYKVVMPDGRVVYTDRPIPIGKSESAPVSVPGNALNPPSELPYLLREPTVRNPALLYSAQGCAPCDEGRNLLKQRGIPFEERVVRNADDLSALRKLTGGSTLPVLQLGEKKWAGLQSQQWNRGLDAAGYPRSSLLPANYAYPNPKPLTDAPSASTPPPTTTKKLSNSPESGHEPLSSVPTTNNPAGIRF